tara:strand:- start:466 stop:951 length:486 start_codon:yes stop_codon:yes gene_type:complete
MSIKLTIKEKDENNEWTNGVDKSQIIDNLIKDIVSDVLVKGIIRKEEGKPNLKKEKKEEIEILKDRLEKEEEKIDKLEESVELLEDKLEESKNIINGKLDEILSILKGDLNKNCQKMSKHIDFVDNVYDTVKNPLGFLVNKMNTLIGNDEIYDLETKNMLN